AQNRRQNNPLYSVQDKCLKCCPVEAVSLLNDKCGIEFEREGDEALEEKKKGEKRQSRGDFRPSPAPHPLIEPAKTPQDPKADEAAEGKGRGNDPENGPSAAVVLGLGVFFRREKALKPGRHGLSKRFDVEGLPQNVNAMEDEKNQEERQA